MATQIPLNTFKTFGTTLLTTPQDIYSTPNRLTTVVLTAQAANLIDDDGSSIYPDVTVTAWHVRPTSIGALNQILGSVDSFSNLLSLDPKIGDGYNVLDEGKLYVWTGNRLDSSTGWVEDQVTTTETLLIKNYSIPLSDASSILTGRLILEQGDRFRIVASHENSVSFILSYLETSNE